MPRNILPIKPLAKALDTSSPPLNQDPLATSWPTVNVQVDSNRIKRCWDYASDRTLLTGSTGQYATLFKRGTGTTNTLMLTDTDLVKKETASGKTWSYLTQQYTTGTIASVGTDLIVNGNFDSTADDWTAVDCTLASVAGGYEGQCLEITRTGGLVQQYAQQVVATLAIGTTYVFTVGVKSGTSGNEAYKFMCRRSSDSGDEHTSEGTTTGSWVISNLTFAATATSYTFYLMKMSATAGTMLFDYVSIFGPRLTVHGTDTLWTGSGHPVAGDKFVMEADLTSDEEPDTYWRTIAAVGDASTLTLTEVYDSGGHLTGGNYIVRRVYSMPTDERWQYSVVNDNFCFTNGNVNVQKWDGDAAAATDLDATNAVKARFCTCYANRLILADMYLSAVRQPWTVKWSKEGDPTNWTDSTAGEVDLAETDEPITGLARVGNNLIVFKNKSYYVGSRTGLATSPIKFPTFKPGVGNWSPYSLVEAMGTCFWLGHDNFYVMNGEECEPIGNAIKYEFFDKVNDTERTKVWGVPNYRYNEILWFATTSDGQRCFSFKYRENSWTTYSFSGTVTGFFK